MQQAGAARVTRAAAGGSSWGAGTPRNMQPCSLMVLAALLLLLLAAWQHPAPGVLHQAAAAAAGGSSAAPHVLRRLMQARPAPRTTPAPVVAAVGAGGGGGSKARPKLPLCMWNDVRELCSPSQLVLLSLKAKPATVLHRASALAYDRNLVCNGRANESDCNRDRANRCMYWNRSCVGMDAYELVNWLGAVPLTGDSAIAAFTCAGTDAASYRDCASAGDAGPKGLCTKLPQCVYSDIIDSCLPVAFAERSIKQLDSLIKAVDGFNVSVWGSCSGSCYVRQAGACDRANTTAACAAKPYCVWEANQYDGKPACLHVDTAARGSDAFSKEYAAIKDTCLKMATEEDCVQPRFEATNVGQFRAQPDMLKQQQTDKVACLL